MGVARFPPLRTHANIPDVRKPGQRLDRTERRAPSERRPCLRTGGAINRGHAQAQKGVTTARHAGCDGMQRPSRLLPGRHSTLAFCRARSPRPVKRRVHHGRRHSRGFKPPARGTKSSPMETGCIAASRLSRAIKHVSQRCHGPRIASPRVPGLHSKPRFIVCRADTKRGGKADWPVGEGAGSKRDVFRVRREHGTLGGDAISRDTGARSDHTDQCPK